MRHWSTLGFAAIVGLSMMHAAPAAPMLNWGDCPDGAHAGESAAVMRCGWLETNTALAGKPVRLRVTRLQRRPERASRHPIVYVPGGPGDPGGQSAPALRRWRRFQQHAGWPRDLVIFDPRGTGLSRPRPNCPASGRRAGSTALSACFDVLGRATAERLGIRAQVADLHRLIHALDGGSAVLWADSFGAVIARRLGQRHPADVQALVLDSPVLDPASMMRRRRAAFVRRRRQLIEFCRRDFVCRLAVPSAQAVLDGLLAELSDRPRLLAMADVPYRPRSLAIDRQALRAMLLLTAYGSDSGVAVVNRMRRTLVEPVALNALARPLMALVGRSARTAPVYWSSRCAAGAAAHGQSACRHWPVAPVTTIAGGDVVPILALAGGKDVLTPARATARFVLARPGRQLVLVRDRGHGVLFDSACAQRWVRRFIASGGAWLGASSCGGKEKSGVTTGQTAAERRRHDVTHVRR